MTRVDAPSEALSLAPVPLFQPSSSDIPIWMPEATRRLKEETEKDPFTIHNIICAGADPFVFKLNDQWNLLVLGKNRARYHGIERYTLRSGPTPESLQKARSRHLQVSSQHEDILHVWAAEMYNKHLYVTASHGWNERLGIHVFESEGQLNGPWKEIGRLRNPKEDDSWAIDMTLAEIPYNGHTKPYAIWSGWVGINDEFPQHIYIAESVSPYEIGKRSMIASPDGEWCSSIRPILEAPQALVIENEFRGILLSGNASWSNEYETRILKYNGGDPLQKSSWSMACEPLFKMQCGIGHGMIVNEGNQLYFFGHRKTSSGFGYDDRRIFYTPISRRLLEEYLQRI